MTRRLWQGIWPDVPEEEIPIASITNGIHPSSWISHDLADLYNRYLGPAWWEDPVNVAIWERVERIPDEELWRTHERRRERMVVFIRRKLRAQLEERGASAQELKAAGEVLDARALTIGFGRRFATYKRATLLLRDPQRLLAILGNPECPVQVIYAGKAHPRDQAGKELIRAVYQLARQEPFSRRIVFLEDYDTATARYLVQGCDIWLNNPRVEQEASGTSGMKAAANGCLHLSILDGWWHEGYRPECGWALGRGELYPDAELQDQIESRELYGLLEHQVVPLFYRRGPGGLPREWIAMMKASMKSICPIFNSNRMVHEYVQRFYLAGMEAFAQLSEAGAGRAKALSGWKRWVQENWPSVQILRAEVNGPAELEVGDSLE
ncbi:MAG: alpha-glucan family phosphorylase, partial [Chloroflexota bacterium]|nr:alpha-glucan family phosphorylase [Chloroflexota bacterium]